jgi:phenylacetate-coenzyme A ligase PaaK-like adenylate-forming protein
LVPSKLQIVKQIMNISSDDEFNYLASIFNDHQLENVPIIAEYRNMIGVDFPFLPIELFKSYVINTKPNAEVIFKSSGTTSSQRSSHHVYDASLYRKLSLLGFEKQFGSVKDACIIALLPSYIDNGDSSLVYMVNYFIDHSQHPESGFIDLDHAKSKITNLQQSRTTTFLFGVSFALIDLAEILSTEFPELCIIETGGMKGQRKEMTRAELHAQIQMAFPSSRIESEYGMTELLSQAYTSDGQWFNPPPWMKVSTVDISDPLTVLPVGQRGLLAITDLANYYSCSFIQTRDVGVVNDFGQFTVEGRLDNSDIRGCNLLHP